MKSPSTSVDCLTLSAGEEETNLVKGQKPLCSQEGCPQSGHTGCLLLGAVP